MKTSELRNAFLKYFENLSHEVVPGSSLVPANDPTLLFTNAGMVQFKDLFLGRESRAYTRATSSQRCVRAGGKHNDLENVGYTARHLTFFEMLGNFSFGDYFKREAIRFAWSFLTEVIELPEEKLWVTVFHEDQEAEDIWLKEMGVSPDRFSRLGAESNFWQMGDIGPCGPCTEIFYDHGPSVAGGPPGSPDEDGDRYIEIWNLVFMQFDRQPNGDLTPLPKPSVDTGMGLERIAAVVQGVHSNYEIDIFVNLLAAVVKITGTKDRESKSLQVIADHIRSCAFLVLDGVVPSNEGRGYVLRRILRRAIRHGNKLGAKGAFFFKLVKPLAEQMGDAYPELIESREHIEKILLLEEEQFAKTLDQGMRILDQDLKGLKGTVIPGDIVFKLYDTYGFPADLTADIAREREFTIDQAGFDEAMRQQKERSQKSGQFAADYHKRLELEGETGFTGYDFDSSETSVTGLYKGGAPVKELAVGEEAIITLGETPFYAESGGQVGDSGVLIDSDFVFEVTDTTKQGEIHLHHGHLTSGCLKTGDRVEARIDRDKRNAIRLNHSATHLLHAALRRVLGDQVAQKGSLVDAGHLRFDFTHFEAMTPLEIKGVETLVNEQIRANTPVHTELMSSDQAKNAGAMALFGEKYGDRVRVLTMGEDGFSAELCGGTHAARTGDIGLFKIVSEGGIAAGIRRIEALTGAGAIEWINAGDTSLSELGGLFKTGRDGVVAKARQTLEKVRQLEKELDRQKAKLASSAGDDLAGRVREVSGIKVLAEKLDGVDPRSLRETVDKLKDKLGSAVIVIGTSSSSKVNLVAGVTSDLNGRLKAGELVNYVASQVGGKGGGRPDMAMAGGSQPDQLSGALASVFDWVSDNA